MTDYETNALGLNSKPFCKLHMAGKTVEVRSQWDSGWIGASVRAQLSRFQTEAKSRRYEKQEKAGLIDAKNERFKKITAIFELAKTSGLEQSKKQWGE